MKTIARSFLILFIFSFVATSVSAQSDPYKTMVKHLKKRYNAKQMRLPFVIGLASFGARIYTKGAVKGLKVAIFKEQNFTEPIKDPGFESVFRSFDTSWMPMIRFYSRKQLQRTYLYAKEAGKDFQIMVAALQADNAVVLSVKVNPVQLAKFIEKHNNGQSILGDFGLDDLMGSRNKTVIAQADSDSAEVSASKSDPIFANAEKPSDASVIADAPATQSLPEMSLPEMSLNAADAPPPAPLKDETIKADITIDTKLVNLNARVANAAGKPIVTLTKENFALYENNVKQEISHFSPVTAPVNLLLLMDFSGSTEKKQDVMRDAAKRFVDALGPHDRVAVAAFARRFYLKTTFISDKKQLKKLIGELKVPSSGTSYYDAMWKALDLFQQANGSRNAVVVLTDGVDNTISDPEEYTTKHEFNELLARIAEEDVTIYPMYLDTEYEMVVKRHGGKDKQEHYAIARKQLSQVSEQSGGLLFHVARIEDLQGVYDRVAAELKTIYSIAYSSNLDDGSRTQKREWREIKLTVNEPGALARTKRGYYAK
jgi:VWFA-related protein